jgi:hypothetical protein
MGVFLEAILDGNPYKWNVEIGFGCKGRMWRLVWAVVGSSMRGGWKGKEVKIFGVLLVVMNSRGGLGSK